MIEDTADKIIIEKELFLHTKINWFNFIFLLRDKHRMSQWYRNFLNNFSIKRKTLSLIINIGFAWSLSYERTYERNKFRKNKFQEQRCLSRTVYARYHAEKY